VTVCVWCDEPVWRGEQHPGVRQPIHKECAIRTAVGSAAHVQGRCGCYVPGSVEGDPPGMTRRQAARAAVEAYDREQRMRKVNYRRLKDDGFSGNA